MELGWKIRGGLIHFDLLKAIVLSGLKENGLFLLDVGFYMWVFKKLTTKPSSFLNNKKWQQLGSTLVDKSTSFAPFWRE